jgi:hypothetical protein
MRRRQFIELLDAAATCPLPARAQHVAMACHSVSDIDAAVDRGLAERRSTCAG